jgi:hypothetical protein
MYESLAEAIRSRRPKHAPGRQRANAGLRRRRTAAPAAAENPARERVPFQALDLIEDFVTHLRSLPESEIRGALTTLSDLADTGTVRRSG